MARKNSYQKGTVLEAKNKGGTVYRLRYRNASHGQPRSHCHPTAIEGLPVELRGIRSKPGCRQHTVGKRRELTIED